MRRAIDYVGLEKFLKTLKHKDFGRNGAINEGHSIEDIEFFKMDKSIITSDQVINVGDPFLIDALGGDLSICVLSKRKYKLPDGRAIRAKFDRTIIKNTREVFGDYLNGYWVIPKKFFTEINLKY